MTVLPARQCPGQANPERSITTGDQGRDFRRERLVVGFDETRRPDALPGLTPTAPDEMVAIREQRFECLERCLDKLKPEQRALVVDYYRDEQRQKIERRREMASRLGITMNALSIRASRIRATLETCVEGCRREQ